MSSTIVSVASDPTVMSASNDLTTHPSSAWTLTGVRTGMNSAARSGRSNQRRMGSPYIAKSNDRATPRHTKRGDHRPRRSRQDDAGRRAAEAEPHLPRQPAGGLADHGLQRPRAREGNHDPRQEHVDPAR